MSIQVFAAVVAGSTPGQWSTDAKGEIRMQEITFAKGNEQQLKDCRDALCRSTLGERYFSSPGSAENAILEGIRQENLYVAFIGEECVGFTYIIPKGAFHSFPYLHIIAVKEEYRNKGIGKALLDYSENIAYEMADRIFLVVADYNPDAKRFYERNGYQQVGEIPNLYRPGVRNSKPVPSRSHRIHDGKRPEKVIKSHNEKWLVTCCSEKLRRAKRKRSWRCIKP